MSTPIVYDPTLVLAAIGVALIIFSIYSYGQMKYHQGVANGIDEAMLVMVIAPEEWKETKEQVKAEIEGDGDDEVHRRRPR